MKELKNETVSVVVSAQDEAYKSGAVQYIDSREVAAIVGKDHRKLLRDIRIYIEQLNQSNIGLVDFFIESTYIDAKGESRPCYMVTKKGCEFIAHKLTGTKGTIFTATYINRFHEMENVLESQLDSNVIQQFMEKQQSFMEELVKMNHSMSDRLAVLEAGKEEQVSFTVGSGPKPFVVVEDESISRKKRLNRLVTQMAKSCGWSRSFALHRLYKTLEEVLDINIDVYVDLYKEEIQGDACAIDAVAASEKLYTTAIRLCNNTLEKMKVDG